MGFEKYLRGSLAEVHDLGLFTDFNLRVFDFFEVDWVLIGEVVEKIEILLCNFTLLFIAEDKVNPLLQLLSYIAAFQFWPMNGYEFIGIVTPNRKMYVVNALLHLSQSKVVVLDVKQNLWQIKELRNKLTHIRYFSCHALPANANWTEQTVTQVKFTALKRATCLGVRLQSNEEVKHHSRRTVMGAVLIGRNRVKWIDCLCFWTIVFD